MKTFYYPELDSLEPAQRKVVVKQATERPRVIRLAKTRKILFSTFLLGGCGVSILLKLANVEQWITYSCLGLCWLLAILTYYVFLRLLLKQIRVEVRAILGISGTAIDFPMVIRKASPEERLEAKRLRGEESPSKSKIKATIVLWLILMVAFFIFYFVQRGMN